MSLNFTSDNINMMLSPEQQLVVVKLCEDWQKLNEVNQRQADAILKLDKDRAANLRAFEARYKSLGEEAARLDSVIFGLGRQCDKLRGDLELQIEQNRAKDLHIAALVKDMRQTAEKQKDDSLHAECFKLKSKLDDVQAALNERTLQHKTQLDNAWRLTEEVEALRTEITDAKAQAYNSLPEPRSVLDHCETLYAQINLLRQRFTALLDRARGMPTLADHFRSVVATQAFPPKVHLQAVEDYVKALQRCK
jgi:hypothetical protein